jgi:hypothetical protein
VSTVNKKETVGAFFPRKITTRIYCPFQNPPRQVLCLPARSFLVVGLDTEIPEVVGLENHFYVSVTVARQKKNYVIQKGRSFIKQNSFNPYFTSLF